MRLEDGLITADALTKRGYGVIIKNTGKVIAVITAMVALLLSFTDIKLSDIGREEVTSNIVVMLISSLIMFFSLEDAGERLSEGTDEYKSTLEEYEKLTRTIQGEDISALRDYCEEYSRCELKARINTHLIHRGISREEYESYLSGDPCNKKRARIMKRLSRLKAYPITPEFLLTTADSVTRDELYTNSNFKLLKMSLKLLPTIVCTLLTVSVALSMKEGLSPSVIIESIIRLLTLPIVALRGYATGYNYSRNVGIPRLKAKARILDSFLREKGRK